MPSSMAFVLFALILLMTLFQNRVMGRRVLLCVVRAVILWHPTRKKLPPPRVNRTQLAIYAVLFAGVIVAVGPFLWMISASFMTLSEVNLTRLLPENLLWEKLRHGFAQG